MAISFKERKRRSKLKVKFTGITIALQRMSDDQVAALYRVAKTRMRAFFADPYSMIELRAEYERRMSNDRK